MNHNLQTSYLMQRHLCLGHENVFSFLYELENRLGILKSRKTRKEKRQRGLIEALCLLFCSENQQAVFTLN